MFALLHLDIALLYISYMMFDLFRLDTFQLDIYCMVFRLHHYIFQLYMENNHSQKLILDMLFDPVHISYRMFVLFHPDIVPVYIAYILLDLLCFDSDLLNI